MTSVAVSWFEIFAKQLSKRSLQEHCLSEIIKIIRKYNFITYKGITWHAQGYDREVLISRFRCHTSKRILKELWDLWALYGSSWGGKFPRLPQSEAPDNTRCSVSNMSPQPPSPTTYNLTVSSCSLACELRKLLPGSFPTSPSHCTLYTQCLSQIKLPYAIAPPSSLGLQTPSWSNSWMYF